MDSELPLHRCAGSSTVWVDIEDGKRDICYFWFTVASILGESSDGEEYLNIALEGSLCL